MSEERLYVVTYDIADDKRWRVVFRLMQAYGEWLQLSVFQCRLTRSRHAELMGRLESAISFAEDHVLVIDLGAVERVEPRLQSLGKRKFDVIKRAPVIV